MHVAPKCLIAGIVAWGAVARAEEPAVPAPAPVAPAPAAAEPAPAAEQSLSDEDLQKMAEGETVEVYDERPDKPFDRDTEVRLTGEQLAARGATDLTSALALLPDVSTRDAGRGGFNIDIRGARKGAVSVLIDGVNVTDPYYGTFDVSTIPITDIEQIRVSTTPQSPIDGPGGPGGVIEVVTRDAIGEQLVIARTTSDSLPSFGVTGTARVALAKKLGLRFSASGLAGARDLELPGNAAIGEQRRSATGTTRLEYRDTNVRGVVDGFLDDRHYISPPSDTMNSAILMVDRETSARVSSKVDVQRDRLQIQAQGWVHDLHRRSRYFKDPTLTTQGQFEDLSALRIGGMALATHPIGRNGRWATSVGVDRDHANVEALNNQHTGGDITLAEIAGDGQYERGTVRLDGAVGAAIPFGVGADPWGEYKAIAQWRPSYGPLELTATVARKGRVPSLRERYDLATGNPALGPEMIDHAEVRGIYKNDRVKIEVAPFYKRTKGTVRVSTDPADMGKLTNLGKLSIYGADLQARVQVIPRGAIGGSYEYVKAHDDDVKGSAGDDPLDRLPHNRADAWIEATPAPGMQVVARVKYFGSSIDQLKPVDGYTLVEASASAQIYRDYMATLRIDDALDVRPETRAGYHSAGRVVLLVLQGEWQ